MVTYGRITSDHDGKINAQSILFEGTLETSLGNTVNLNLNKVSKFSLFPGQVAVVQGNHPNSSTFIAKNIFTDAILPLPSEPPLINSEYFYLYVYGILFGSYHMETKKMCAKCLISIILLI